MNVSRLISAYEAFTRFIESFRDTAGNLKYEQSLIDMAIKGLKSLTVDFHDIYAFDNELARNIIINPEDFLPKIDAAAFQKLHIHNYKYAKKIQGVHVRLTNLPTETPLQRIGAIHIGKLVMVNGDINRISAVSPLPCL